MQYLKLFEEFKVLNFLLFRLNVPQWNDILSNINPEHVWKIENTQNEALPGGFQKHPHVTILFGFPTVPLKEMEEVLQSYPIKDFKFEVENIDIFPGKMYDVLKMTVKPTQELNRLHHMLKRIFPTVRQHKKFSPHITMAYIKKQYSHLYIKPEYTDTFYSNTIIYSSDSAQSQEVIVLTDTKNKLVA